MSQGPTFFYEDPDFGMRQLSDEAFQIFSGVWALAAGDKDDSGHALNVRIRKTTSLLKNIFKASRAGVTTFFFFFLVRGQIMKIWGLWGTWPLSHLFNSTLSCRCRQKQHPNKQRWLPSSKILFIKIGGRPTG